MAGLPGLNFGGPSRKTVQDLTEGDHEFSTRPNESVYFINCSDSNLSVNSRSAKVSSYLIFILYMGPGFGVQCSMLAFRVLELRPQHHISG